MKRAAPPPAAGLRQRVQRWWLARLPATDHLELTQHNIFLLPTGAGWMLALTLLVLLIASINFQLNLGYLLTFLLAGSAAAGVVMGHNSLRGLQLRLLPPEPCFQGHSAQLTVELHNPAARTRYAIALGCADAQRTTPTHWAHTDVPAQGSAALHLGFVPARRGLHSVPLIGIQTHFPLGTFRIWSWWRPHAQLLVYPAPEATPPPLPPGEPRGGQGVQQRSGGMDGFDGVRAYQRGDPLKLVHWKKAAQTLATGSGELLSRDAQHSPRHELWIDVQRTGLADPEARLARATAWVLQAERQGLRWGLRLPGGHTLGPDEGALHRRRCLEALALC